MIQLFITTRIVDHFGLGRHFDAVHGCVTARGPRQIGSSTVTMASRGTLSDPVQRAGVLSLIGGHS